MKMLHLSHFVDVFDRTFSGSLEASDMVAVLLREAAAAIEDLRMGLNDLSQQSMAQCHTEMHREKDKIEI